MSEPVTPPANPPVEIPNHMSRGAAAASGCAIPVGLLFAGVGLLVLFLSARRFEEELDSKQAIAAAVGLLFTLVGSTFAVSGVRGMAATRRMQRLLADNPLEPWLADHAWTGTRVLAERRGGCVAGVVGMAILCLFLAPFNWWAWFSKDGTVMVRAIVSLFDLLPIVLLGGLVYEHWKRIRWGRAHMDLDAFPLFVGQRAGGRIVPARELREGTLKLRLRAIEERRETRQTGPGRNEISLRAYCHHEATLAVDMRSAVEGQGVRFAFDLPREAPGTKLSDSPPRYWELTASADTPGIDFEEVFLLPVYRRGEGLG